jgi:hypothetical protein
MFISIAGLVGVDNLKNEIKKTLPLPREFLQVALEKNQK